MASDSNPLSERERTLLAKLEAANRALAEQKLQFARTLKKRTAALERARIDAEMRRNLVLRGGPDAMLVTKADSPYRGLTLTQIAGLISESNAQKVDRLIKAALAKLRKRIRLD